MCQTNGKNNKYNIKRKVNMMKAQVSNFLKSKIIQGGLLLTLVAAVIASVGWSNERDGRVKQGGAWVGQLAGIQWTAIHAPLDADGQRAAMRLQWVTINAEFQGFLGALGAQHMSAASGISEMISKDTAKFTLVFYAVADGTPSPTAPQPDQVKAIFVMKGKGSGATLVRTRRNRRKRSLFTCLTATPITTSCRRPRLPRTRSKASIGICSAGSRSSDS